MATNDTPSSSKELGHYLGVVGRIVGRNLSRDSVEAIVRELEEFEQLTPLVGALSEGHAYGFYEGLIAGLTDSPQFRRRFGTGQHEKSVLAEYCLKILPLKTWLDKFRAAEFSSTSAPHRERVFFESGTTISYIVGRLAKELRNINSGRKDGIRPLPATIITNNLICITALATFVESVIPTHGRLEYKYFGFLACEESVPKNRNDLNVERADYVNLVDSIIRCNSVFGTCSRFSFLLGPLVGSRSNCLTKCAMYQGAGHWSEAEGREFILSFHFGKVIPIVHRQGAPSPGNLVSFEAPDDRCRHVFSVATGLRTDNIENWNKNFSELLRTTQFRPALDWYKSVVANTDKRKVPIVEVNEACTQFGVDPFGDLPNWGDWVKLHPFVKLLIALPNEGRDAAIEHLEHEIRVANHFFAKKSVAYSAINLEDARQTGVAAIRIRNK